MPTRLKDTDVVVIGLGMAGGVAVLPLAQAGIEVIGLEAGILADAPRLRARRTPQQRPRLADGGAQDQRGSADRPRDGLVADDARRTPDDERRRRHRAALLGAALAPEPVGLQGGERNDAPVRRVAHPEGIDRRGLAVRLRRARAVLREDRVRGRRLGAGGQHQRQDRSARQPIRGRRASASTRCRRCAGRRSTTRWPGPRGRSGGIRSRARPRSTRVHTRTAQAACTTASAIPAAATSTRRTRRT